MWLAIFSINFFWEKLYLMVHGAKECIMLFGLKLKKGVIHKSILSYGFSAQKIFIMEMLTLKLLRKGWMPNFRPFKWCKVFRIRKLLKVRTCWKCNKNERQFSYERYFTERAIFEKPISSFSDGEKHETITRRNILLKQVKII